MSGKDNKGNIRIQIENFADLTVEDERKPVEIGNVEWILAARSETSDRTNNVKHLGVFLKCKNDSRSNLWSCDAFIRLSLVKLNSNDKNDAFTMEFDQKFDCNNKILEVPNFKNWEEAICYDNRFIVDKHAIVAADITVKNVVGIHEKILETFDTAKDNLTDVVLIVEGKKVHVGKQVLAIQSQYFHSLFYSKFAEGSQSEIAIEDVVHSEFVDLLNLIYPTHKIIDDDNVAHLLKLADRFQVPRVLEKCANHLIYSKIHIVNKLKFAETYKLSALQDQCLDELKSAENVTALKKHADFKLLGDVTYNVLLQKLIDILG